MRRRGFTIVELVVTIAVLGFLMVAAWRFFGASVSTSKRVLGTLDAQQTLRMRLQQLVQDLQGAHKLFFPTPGGQSQPGIGYVDRQGRAIMVFTKAGEDGKLTLYKADLNAKTREVLAEDVASFRVTLPDPPDGAVARTVNLAFGLFAEGTETTEGKRVPTKLATSVTLRALEERFPD